MKTVFVFDDDGLMREMLTRLLEKTGYRVRTFPSPLPALPLIDSGYPDLIVSDVQMPEMGGMELARHLREQEIAVPIVLVTGSAVPDIEEEAGNLNIDHIFEKPIRDLSTLSVCVDRAIAKREDVEKAAGLDRLRMSFLTGLAHELRTPLTAIKLALDGLFTSDTVDIHSSRGRLLSIGQRNLDRIIRLVEGQLDLLQITLGDVSVSRKLVCVRDIVERAAGEVFSGARKGLVVGPMADARGGFLFTDPDRLRAVIRHVLENGSHQLRDTAQVRLGVLEDGQVVEIVFEDIHIPVGAAATTDFSLDQVTADNTGCDPNSGDDDFETRAFRRIIASLSGEIRISDSGGERNLVLRFPLCPRFDSREDLVVPINSLREAAMLSGKNVSLLKCDVGGDVKNGTGFSQTERNFFARCASALSEDDALVRGRTEGRYFCVLIERDLEEIERICRFLEAPSGVDQLSVRKVETTVLRTLTAGSQETDAILFDLETVQ